MHLGIGSAQLVEVKLVSGSLSSHLESRLEELKQLSTGWDGTTDSEPPEPRLIDFVRRVLLQLQEEEGLDVGAGPAGEVDLLWEGKGVFATFHTDNDCSISYAPRYVSNFNDVKHIQIAYGDDDIAFYRFVSQLGGILDRPRD